MRAAILTARGEPPAPGEFEDPRPQGDDPVLEVLVAGINPIDLSIAAGKVPVREREHPSVPGIEGVGQLNGRRYYFDTPVAPFGSLAERALVAHESLIEIPDQLDPGLAVSLGVAGFAAWLGLTWRAELQPGEHVLVLGASGIVGQLAVQAARLLGAGKVVAAARDEPSLERARHELGADAVVQLGGEGDLAERLREAVGGGYDVVVDPLWGEPAAAALAALHPEGRLVAIGNSAGETAEIPGRDFRNRLGQIVGHTNFRAPREVKREAYAAMARHAAAGELTVPVAERPLEEVAAAWEEQAESPHHKLMVRLR
ncbi:MAG TPA: zinc-binding alcohol dehydrogenase family protein [Solirubrobacterales bacterium]|nr:zinc-binding alcohol dehydrogenase family protein [Solirubrobacterales bacterium]